MAALVKGITRRVILVKPPDPKLFEQAIFIMREDASPGVTAEDVLREAQRTADVYVRRNSGWRKRLDKIPAPAYTVVGALLASVMWSILIYLPL